MTDPQPPLPSREAPQRARNVRRQSTTERAPALEDHHGMAKPGLSGKENDD